MLPVPEQPATPPQQPNQVEMLPGLENMDIDTLEDIPDFIGVNEEILSDFNDCAYSVLKYHW